MSDKDSEIRAEILLGFDASKGQATFLARNLTDSKFRWVVCGLGGGALAIWALREVGKFVLELLELLLRYGG